jgi:hypothetical protein
MATKAQQAERAAALERIRESVKPGDTLYTILRHRSASGMLRVIDVKALDCADARYPVVNLGWNVAKALGEPWDDRKEGIRVGGCGMDMGFHLIYNLASALYPDGFGCIGKGCPSNDHSNGDRDYTPYWHRDTPKPNDGQAYSADHWHRNGGYALRQRWI